MERKSSQPQPPQPQPRAGWFGKLNPFNCDSAEKALRDLISQLEEAERKNPCHERAEKALRDLTGRLEEAERKMPFNNERAEKAIRNLTGRLEEAERMAAFYERKATVYESKAATYEQEYLDQHHVLRRLISDLAKQSVHVDGTQVDPAVATWPRKFQDLQLVSNRAAERRQQIFIAMVEACREQGVILQGRRETDYSKRRFRVPDDGDDTKEILPASFWGDDADKTDEQKFEFKMLYDVHTPAHEEQVAKLDCEILELQGKVNDWSNKHKLLSGAQDILTRDVAQKNCSLVELQKILSTQRDHAQTIIEKLADQLVAERRNLDKAREESAREKRLLQEANENLEANTTLEKETLQIDIKKHEAIIDGLRRDLGMAALAARGQEIYQEKMLSEARRDYTDAMRDNAIWRQRLGQVEAENKALAAAREQAETRAEVRDSVNERLSGECVELKAKNEMLVRKQLTVVMGLQEELNQARLKLQAQTAPREEEPQEEQPGLHAANSFDGTLVLASEGQQIQLRERPSAPACRWASANVNEDEGCDEEMYAVRSLDGTFGVVLDGQREQLLEQRVSSDAARYWAAADCGEDYVEEFDEEYDDMSDLITEEEFHTDSEEYNDRSFYFSDGEDHEYLEEIPRPGTPYPPEVGGSDAN